MSFAEEKHSIDNDKHSKRFGREKLAGMVQESKIADYKVITKDKDVIKKEKVDIEHTFHNTLNKEIFDVKTFKQIDQENDGACTLVALLHLIHINGLDKDIHNKDWAQIRRKTYWKKNLWDKIERKAWDQNNLDIRYFADLLDIGKKLKHPVFVKLLGVANFKYIPIRGEKQRELLTNKIFFKPASIEAAKIRFGADVVDKNPVTCGVGEFIESNIDRGNVVGISYNGHARVAVAYNNTHLLFADSWDSSIMDEIINNEHYVDGLSIVNKYSVYAYARDIIYFDRSNRQETPEKPTKSQQPNAPQKKVQVVTKTQAKPKAARRIITHDETPEKPTKSQQPNAPQKFDLSLEPKNRRRTRTRAVRRLIKDDPLREGSIVDIIRGRHIGKKNIRLTKVTPQRVYFNNNKNWAFKKDVNKK